jgi:hypothetical protein
LPLPPSNIFIFREHVAEMKSIVKVNDLLAFIQEVYQNMGASKENSQISAEVMVEANLCGVDSHGVRMLPGFVTLMRNGKIKPQGRIQAIKETPVIAHLDANLAPGHVVSVQAMKMAVKRQNLRDRLCPGAQLHPLGQGRLLPGAGRAGGLRRNLFRQHRIQHALLGNPGAEDRE